MKEVVVIAARRTAVGRALKGSLRHTRSDDLGAAVVRDLLTRVPGLDLSRIGDVIMGCAMPEGEQGMNVGRNIALLAGLLRQPVPAVAAVLRIPAADPRTPHDTDPPHAGRGP